MPYKQSHGERGVKRELQGRNGELEVYEKAWRNTSAVLLRHVTRGNEKIKKLEN